MPRSRPTLLTLGAVTTALGLSGLLTAPAMAADNCPNAAVRAQQHATSLPQCRAYEIINPPGLDLGDVNRIIYTTNDGDGVAYLSVGAANDAIGAGVASVSVARRGADGWKSTNADPFATGASNAGTAFTGAKTFSDDLSRSVVDALLPMNTQDTDGISDYYRVDVGLGSTTLMSQDEDMFPVLMGGASRDLDRIVFLGSAGGVSGLWMSDGTSRELLSVYPDNITPVPSGQASFASPQYERGKSIGGSGGTGTAGFVERGGAHGVSDDARRVYFTDFSGKLYLRDSVASPARTVVVSVSSRTGDVGTVYPASFISATHDGSSAYFASSEQLTDDATPGGGIYRFDLATQSVTQVTPSVPGGFDVTGSLVSDDQSHIYFTSTAALAGAAQPGDRNVYVWTSGGAFRFIAKAAENTPLTRVTPDGRYLLLLSSASIDGAPNNFSQALYRYDYLSDHTTCVSCRADGSPSRGAAYIDAQSYGQPGASLIRNRGLSFDGQVAFTSTDRLVPEDQTSALDVYLYHDGTVSLLTKGRGDTGSYVGDISDDGKNVSVLTRSPLVGGDRDVEEYDAYNVRVDGGFPEPPPPSSPCHGEDCQAPPASAPQLLAPSSSWADGAGNVSSARAARKLSVARVSTAQRARLARKGVVTLRVRVAGGGRLSVRGRGRVGGRMRTLGSASRVVRASKATSVPLTVGLSRAARKQLSSSGRLRVTFVARLGGLSEPKTATVNLIRAHR